MEKKTDLISSAWHDLTGEKGWWHPVLILALVNLIPIVGSIFTTGYLLDWAREGAWGMKRGLPRTVGDLGKRGKWGLYAIVIIFVWYLPFSIVSSLFNCAGFIGAFFALIVDILGIIAMIIAGAAVVYAVIYDKLAAGFQVKKLWGMARMNPGGLAVCFLASVLVAVVWFIAAIIAFAIIAPVIFGAIGVAAPYFVSEFGGSYSMLDYSYVGEGLGALFAFGGLALLLLLIVSFIAMFFSTMMSAVYYRVVGYWVGQFKPAEWNGYKEKMPFEREGADTKPAASAAESAAPLAPEVIEEPAEATAAPAKPGDAPIEVEAQVEDVIETPAVEKATPIEEPEPAEAVEEPEAEVEAEAEEPAAAEEAEVGAEEPVAEAAETAEDAEASSEAEEAPEDSEKE